MENVARVKINGESCMVLLDNGAQVNTIMPKYISDHSLQVGPITDIMGSKVTCMGLGNVYTKLLGYVVIWVQVDRVLGYDKDQITLVILDFPNFVAQIPVILGTPTIGWVINVMKEAEVDALAMLWANVRVVHLLSVCRMVPMEVGDGQKAEVGTGSYNQLMYTQNAETIEPFSSHVVPVKAGRAHTGEHINIMVQVIWTEDGSLLQGLTLQNMYTESRQGSEKAVVVVRNNTAYLQTPPKGNLVARVVAVLPVPKPLEEEQLLERAAEPHDSHTPRLTDRQRHGRLFDKLDLSGLESWTLELADAACWLLAKYHDMFLLDPAELGCTHSMEHMINITNETPFKEWFRQIPPPLVEEVRNHLQEMLESGAIRPSQSAWCYAVVLVWKKDGGLWFCIDFCHLNACMKKDSYPLLRIQVVLESLVGAGHFSCLDLKSGFWQIKMEEVSKQYTTFTVGNLGFFECNCMPFGLCNALATFQWIMQNCLDKLNLIYCLIYLDNLIVFSQTMEEHLHHLCVMFDWLREYNLKLKLLKCSLFREEINYLAHWLSKQGV